MRFYSLILAAALALPACATPTTEPERLPAGQWRLDPAHTSVTWRVRHMGLSWYTARFDTVEAVLDFDPGAPEGASLTVLIDPRSISTGDPEFDRELAEDWFHAGRYPQIRFVSNTVRATGENRGVVAGSLSMNGHEASVEIDTVFNGGLTNILEGREAIGFSASATLDRTEFGIGNLPQTIIGRNMHILIESEFLLEGDRP